MNELRREAEARIEEAIRRIARFHAASEYQRRRDVPLVPPPASEQEIGALGAEIGIPLPAEYRMLLTKCRYLFIYDGYRIWGIGDPGLQRPSVERWGDREGLVFGDFWRDGDGDNLVLDLQGPQKDSVLVWHHDESRYEPLAPSLSEALITIVDDLFPEEHFDEAVQRTREHNRFAERPWLERFFGGSEK